MTIRHFLLRIVALVLLVMPSAVAGNVARVYADQAPLAPPVLDARAAIAIDASTGNVLYEKNSRSQMAIASTTKIMTAILAVQYAKMDDIVTIKGEDLVGEASMGLQVGEQITVQDLLYGMLLDSGNDAAMAIARHVGESLSEPADTTPVARFVSLMNAKAQQLGLTNTHFVNPHGLDADGHYSCAYDLAIMAREFKTHPLLAKIASTQEYVANGHQLANLNKFLTQYPGADGLKTGQTDNAGLCLVASADHGGPKVITVVLNSDRWYDDTAALMDYAFGYMAQLPTATPTATPSTASASAAGRVVTSRSSVAPTPRTADVAVGKPASFMADWPALVVALLAAIASVAGLRMLIVVFARRLAPAVQSSRRPELAQAPGMATGLGGYLPAGDGWPELPREANKSKDRRTRAGHRSDGQSDPDMANDEGERDYSGLFAGSSESVAVLLQEVRDKLLAGDEEGATLGLIRLIRNNQDVCGELEAELGSLPPNSLACAIRALLVCGEREHAKALLGHAASLHPRDSRLQVLGRLID